MSVEYTNRNGKTYRLHEGVTSKGNLRYYFSQKEIGNLVDEIPAGYEIYEHPNSQVYLRKKTEQVVTLEELRLVEAALRKREIISLSQLRKVDQGNRPFGISIAPDLFKERLLSEYGPEASPELENIIDDAIEDAFDPFARIMAKLQEEHYIAEIRKKEIVVYEIQDSNAQPLLKFTLANEEYRIFSPSRYCFLGSIDDWVSICSDGFLPDLVEKCCPCLGTDEFYELY